MTHFVKKALADIRSNRFLNLITIITISLSILVVSVFLLFFENTSRLIESWNQGGRAMVYLADTFSKGDLPDLTARLQGLGFIENIPSNGRASNTCNDDLPGFEWGNIDSFGN